jgi:hypothetical protein
MNISIKSASICCQDLLLLAPFALQGLAVNKALIPVALRRRTALTTQMAITAARDACDKAEVDRSRISSVFVSLGGEIQVTDALCRLLPDQEALLSPTQFHNSVHNTTAGYWGILNHCQKPSTSIAAVDDGFAMGLVEAITQLYCGEETILLVCYEEKWPQYLAPPIGNQAFACAFVLERSINSTKPYLTFPKSVLTPPLLNTDWCNIVKQAPAAAAIPLLQAIKQQQSGKIPLNINPTFWQTSLHF